MSDDIKNMVIEAVQEAIYDLESRGDLIWAEEFRESLAILKKMTPEEIWRYFRDDERLLRVGEGCQDESQQ